MAKERDALTTLSSWGTLEELLLACAVNRHGTKSWDSVAVEVLNRTSTLSSLTSQQCKDKFNDLRRRFMPRSHHATASSALVPMVDELRRLRVEELRREVQRRDVSIEALELKVKRLEEEREIGLKEEADLARDERPSTETAAEKSAAGYDSADDRENGSFNESNSTSQQQKAGTTTLKGEADIKPELDSKHGSDPGRDHSDPLGERISSYNGNLDEGDKQEEKSQSEEKERKRKAGHSGRVGGESNNELGESVGESKREEKEKEKQNSDVQSSVSLKKKRRRRVGGATGVASSSGEELDGGDAVSPARKRVAAVKSEPLVRILEIIWSHRLGSVFERRLRSQESERYKSLIRQHIDLRTVQLRLDKGVYLSCTPKFYRDLLLLFNNAILFFKESSPENNAARELRSLVLRHMKDKLQKPPPSRPQPQPQTLQPQSKPPAPPPTNQIVKPESSSQKKTNSISKPDKSSSTLVSCGKRSISLKASSEKPSSIKLVSSSGSSKQKQRATVEEKPKVNPKKSEPSVPKAEEKGKEEEKEEKVVRKARTTTNAKEVPGVKGRRNARTTTANKKGEAKHKYGGNELSSHDTLDVKAERKEENNNNSNNTTTTVRKRKGAASFLKRMKQNSDTTNNDDDSSSSSSSLSSSSSDEEEDKTKEDKGKEKKGNNKVVKRVQNKSVARERPITRSSRGRGGGREDSGKGRRGGGRVGRKGDAGGNAVAAAAESSGKRGRDGGDGGAGEGGSGGRARKRTRR
ncbi:hypothetical protein LINPERPRIM_LOCUS11621 [Linum perenne]